MSKVRIDQSVSSLFERYLARQDIKPNTVLSKQRALRYYLAIVGDSPVGEVRPADCEDFKAALVKEDDRGDARMSKSSANTYINVFRPFFQWAQGHGYIGVNPFFGIFTYKTERTPPVAFENPDLGLMAENFDLLWRVRLGLGLNGCRRGEMTNVVVREIHMDSENPHIQIGPKVRSDNTWPWSAKAYRTRYIPMPERIMAGGKVLEFHRDIVQLIEDLDPGQPYPFMEPRYFKKMISRQKAGTLTQQHLNDPCGNFQRMFGLRQNRAGIVEIKRYHELRAGFMTKVCSKHGIKLAADAAGIKSLHTAARYDRTSTMEMVSKAANVAAEAYLS
jgi:hypothetical protein